MIRDAGRTGAGACAMATGMPLAAEHLPTACRKSTDQEPFRRSRSAQILELLLDRDRPDEAGGRRRKNCAQWGETAACCAIAANKTMADMLWAMAPITTPTLRGETAISRSTRGARNVIRS